MTILVRKRTGSLIMSVQCSNKEKEHHGIHMTIIRIKNGVSIMIMSHYENTVGTGKLLMTYLRVH